MSLDERQTGEMEAGRMGEAGSRKMRLYGVGLLLMLVGWGLLLIVVLCVVPRYVEAFSDVGADVPWITVRLINFSSILRSHWMEAVLTVGVVGSVLIAPCVLLPDYRKTLLGVYFVGAWLLFVVVAIWVILGTYLGHILSLIHI